MPKKSKSDIKPKKKSKTKTSKKKLSSEESETQSNVLSTDIMDSENDSTDDINIDSDSENKDCEIEKLINDDMDYFEDGDSSEIQQETKSIYLEKNERITNPRLTRYEMVRILGERTKQLTMGAKPLVKNHNDLTYEEIAVEELRHNMIPFKIKRPLPNKKIEIWELHELSKKHLESFIDND